jgi:integrase
MERKSRKSGSVTADRGKLYIRLFWRHPTDPTREHRWNIPTGQNDTPANRRLHSERLALLNAKIQGGAFFPCQEFPGQKIASFCPCAGCSVVEPMDYSHHAPRTLSELFEAYRANEEVRSQGEDKIIEASTFRTKSRHMAALCKSFITFDETTEEYKEVEPLAHYHINELTPDLVQAWLIGFQNRVELKEAGKPPATTKYMNDLASAVRHALKYGQFRRWWRTHPLLEHGGYLIQRTKQEKNRQINKTMHKPFSLVERDRIIDHLKKKWMDTPVDEYRGKNKPHALMIYAYVVIGFNTGMRSPSEVTALEWSDIDYARQSINVRKSREASGKVEEQIIRQYTKTVKHREVPMNDAVIAAFRLLEQYRQEDSDWVFWNPRAEKNNPFLNENGWAPMTGEKRIRHPFDKALKALEIPNPTHQGQYRMRHTFVTTVLDNTDLEDSVVAHMIGDTVETMKTHYQGHCKNRWHSSADRDKLNAINQIGRGRLAVVK